MSASYRWIGFIAARYVSQGRRNRSSPGPVLAVLGIFTGVLALTVILAVMNGFQLGFIESIVEIASYHIRMDALPPETDLEALAKRVRSLSLIRAAVPFLELQGVIRGARNSGTGKWEVKPAVIRGLPPDVLEQDPVMAARLGMAAGEFDLRTEGAIILGEHLAYQLAARPGDTVSLVSLAGVLPENASAENAVFTLTGTFRSGFFEYDQGWGFIALEAAQRLAGEGSGLSLGIKTRSRWQDVRAMEAIQQDPAVQALAPGAPARSWRDYNRAFFGVLRMEKLLMFILVGLIFIVVGLNIFQTQRRAVLERREEIGLFRAVGAPARSARLIFVWDGFIIGITGAGLGMALGLLIAGNIGAFFSLLEGLVNAGIGCANWIAGLLGFEGGQGGRFAVFSDEVFYIKDIPARIIPLEALLIFLFGFLSALLAAWFASGRVSQTNPAEVLRDE
ncbi:MAG: ABC transporter permease [Treponema sp.]|jgi:lipoprotein-releasing system permease protein|nr:ABC transporter permease [Treponema sp.]